MKKNVNFSCACGMNCGREMQITENDENSKLVILQVKTPKIFIPEFFELNRENALELVRYLIAKFKLRDEIK